jgi:hypothetical protein
MSGSLEGEDHYFPPKHCIECFAELSTWTSVEDCLAAARNIEGRALQTDVFDGRLITPFIDSDVFQAVYVKCLEWMIESYSPPAPKIRLARLIDPSITDQTEHILLDTRFRPTVRAGAPDVLAVVAPSLVGTQPQRFFLLEADPHVIELVQNPLRCLIDMMSRTMPTAEECAQIVQSAKQTGNPPTIFHQPYSDGPLVALVEAMFFYVHGLTLGPVGAEVSTAVNMGFRSVEVIGRPPIDPKLFEVAQASSESLFENLGK